MVKKKKAPFTEKERLILKTLYNHRRWMSISEMARKINMSRPTLNKYIKGLKKRRWVMEE